MGSPFLNSPNVIVIPCPLLRVGCCRSPLCSSATRWSRRSARRRAQGSGLHWTRDGRGWCSGPAAAIPVSISNVTETPPPPAPRSSRGTRPRRSPVSPVCAIPPDISAPPAGSRLPLSSTSSRSPCSGSRSSRSLRRAPPPPSPSFEASLRVSLGPHHSSPS